MCSWFRVPTLATSTLLKSRLYLSSRVYSQVGLRAPKHPTRKPARAASGVLNAPQRFPRGFGFNVWDLRFRGVALVS